MNTITALMVRPTCPANPAHGFMALRSGAQTKEQEFCGVWYDCKRDACRSSTLYPSMGLITQWESMGDYRLSRR